MHRKLGGGSRSSRVAGSLGSGRTCSRIRHFHARWSQMAVGKVNVVQSTRRKARLIMDLSISGGNAACKVREQFCLPSLYDIRHSYPLRGSADPVQAFFLDISAAHKTVRVRDSEQGLLDLRSTANFTFIKSILSMGGKDWLDF